MIIETSAAEQYRDSADDDLRVLIVGGGIAGVTLAQLLRAQGRHPILVERSASAARMTGGDAAGYMLALMPLVDPIIDELGIRDAYRDRSVLLDDFDFRSHRGEVLAAGSIGNLLSEFGEYRGIARGDLIDVLTDADCPVAFGATVTRIDEDGGVRVDLDSRDDEPVRIDADLVVIADGLGSHTRGLVDTGRVERYDTAWGCWVAWTDVDDRPSAGTEVWGDGFFLGVYPVRDRLGVVLGGPDSRLLLGPRRFAAWVRSRLTTITPRVEAALDAVAAADDPYLWPLHDARAARWTTDSTVLLGDAAAGFLPTAGVGAGMAMESAWALSEVLRAATRGSLSDDLRRFEAIARPRVEKAQDNSRALARMMFRTSTAFAAVRSMIVRAVSLRVALRPIIGLLENRMTAAQLRGH